MAESFLYDLPLSFYQNAVLTDGEFDPKKAALLGYSPLQFPAIEKFLGLDSKDPAPLLAVEEED